jgi:hypothetical protein
MSLFYNGVKPLNIKPFYAANDIIDFTIKLRPGRAVKAGSLRVSGWLSVQKIAPGSSAAVPIVANDCVFTTPYAGVHSFFRNSTCSVNDRTLESNTMYPRWASMVKQSKYTLEGLNTSSAALTELCGSQNNVLLQGSEICPNPAFPSNVDPGIYGTCFSIPFSFKPEVALNKSSMDLGQSKFPQMKLLFNMASAIEALYSTASTAYIAANIGSLQYSLNDIQLQWYETIERPMSMPITFQTAFLITQTLVSSNASFAVNSPTVYDAVSISFIQQQHRNRINYDNYACEYVPGLDNVGSRVEATVSGSDQPIRFPILTYSELALNYARSLAAEPKNSLMNVYSSQNGCWGIGYKFQTGINDRLAVNVILNGTLTVNPSVTPSDAFIFVSGFVSI